MRDKQSKNRIASIQDRLKQIAKQSNRDVDSVLLQFFQERFLYRVSVSAFAENLILKGALLLLINHIDRFRPTKDIDFLGRRLDNAPENIIRIIKEIAMIECDDGVDCFAESIQAQIIKEGALYEGVRIKFDMGLGKIRKRLTLRDIQG